MARFISLSLSLLFFLLLFASCASRHIYSKESVYSLCTSSYLSIDKASKDTIRFTFLDTDICSYSFVNMGDNKWAIYLALGKFEKFNPNISSFAKKYISNIQLEKDVILFNTLKDGSFERGEKSNIFYFKISKENNRIYNNRLGVVSPSLNKHPAKHLQEINVKKDKEIYTKPISLAKNINILECFSDSDILFRAKGDGAFKVQSGVGFGNTYYVDFLGINQDKKLKIAKSCADSKNIKIIGKQLLHFPDRLRLIVNLDTPLQIYPFSLGDSAGLATKRIGFNYLTNFENNIISDKESEKVSQRIKLSFSMEDFNIAYIEERDNSLVVEVDDAVHLTGYALHHDLENGGILKSLDISYSSSSMVLSFTKKLPKEKTIITYDKMDNDLYIYLTNK